MDKLLEVAKSIISQELAKLGYKNLKIILFGSRARENYKQDSDWDFLVVVDKEIERSLKMRIQMNIRRKLTFENIPSDVILISENNYNERLNDTGYIVYYAVKEGIIL